MPRLEFALLNALSAATWAVLGGAGWLFGQAAQTLPGRQPGRDCVPPLTSYMPERKRL
jgi:hypothetical protein